MTKNELIEYLNSLIEKVKVEKDDILNIRFGELLDVKGMVDSVRESSMNLTTINFEKLDDFINIPYNVLNILMLYQLILKSKTYKLNNDQLVYINYLFKEFGKIMDKTIREKIGSDADVSDLNKKLYLLNEVKRGLTKREHLSLSEYVVIVKMVKGSKELAEYCDEILANISNYLRYSMVGNEYQNLNYGKKNK